VPFRGILGGVEARRMSSEICKFAVVLAVTLGSASAQTTGSIKVPEYAKAGGTVEIVITLDVAPDFDGTYLLVEIAGPGSYTMSNTTTVTRGEKEYTFSFYLWLDAPIVHGSSLQSN
jgi:hypothetical protein